MRVVELMITGVLAYKCERGLGVFDVWDGTLLLVGHISRAKGFHSISSHPPWTMSTYNNLPLGKLMGTTWLQCECSDPFASCLFLLENKWGVKQIEHWPVSMTGWRVPERLLFFHPSLRIAAFWGRLIGLPRRGPYIKQEWAHFRSASWVINWADHLHFYGYQTF